jgi:hypothetical protein
LIIPELSRAAGDAGSHILSELVINVTFNTNSTFVTFDTVGNAGFACPCYRVRVLNDTASSWSAQLGVVNVCSFC